MDGLFDPLDVFRLAIRQRLARAEQPILQPFEPIFDRLLLGAERIDCRRLCRMRNRSPEHTSAKQ